MPHYEHVLNTKENFRACNQGIRAKDQSMATYKQYKNALTTTQNVLYWKMDVLPYPWSCESCIYR